MIETDLYEIELMDDGTLDTVIGVTDKGSGRSVEWRYDGEMASEYRDEDSGALDLQAFADDVVIPDADAEPWDD